MHYNDYIVIPLYVIYYVFVRTQHILPIIILCVDSGYTFFGYWGKLGKILGVPLS